MSETQIDIASIMKSAGGYSGQCFPFIRDGLAHATELVHGSPDQTDELGLVDDSRHVDGAQLCLGLRDLAIQRYGLMASTVLNKWGIYETRDFGNIIFALVEANLMRKTDDDSIEDFDRVYDFDEAFQTPCPGPEPIGA